MLISFKNRNLQNLVLSLSMLNRGVNTCNILIFFCLFVLLVPSFSSNTKFSELALSKLEEHGMPVLKAMEILVNDVKKAIKLHLNAEEENKLSEITGEEYVSAVLRLWLAGKGLRSPTWQSLLDLLRDINEEKLSQQIESYLNGKLLPATPPLPSPPPPPKFITFVLLVFLAVVKAL